MTEVKERRSGMLRTLADRAAKHPRIKEALLGAVEQTLLGVIEEVVREIAQGEQLRMYSPKKSREVRRERDARIEAALRTGEQQKVIARRFHVSLRHVERVSARISRQSTP